MLFSSPQNQQYFYSISESYICPIVWLIRPLAHWFLQSVFLKIDYRNWQYCLRLKQARPLLWLLCRGFHTLEFLTQNV